MGASGLRCWTCQGSDLQELAGPVVKSAVDMYNKITSDLLPTPVKCHYTFNLRDPAKMIQGMMMVNVGQASN